MALNSNGTEALISAFRATVSGKPKAGAAYVYRMVEDKHGIETWRIRQKLTAQTADGKNDASPDARFGKCALGPGVALIGAQQAPVDGLTEAGAAYLYRYQDKHWRIRQKLTAQTDAGASDVEANAHFGVTSLSANGGTAMVGAYDATASGKTGAGAVYAFESPYVLKVTTSVGAVGAVTSQPNGIVCGSGIYCQARFAKGTAVTLTAHPIEGYRFTGWSGGGCAGKKPCTVKLNKSKTVEAKYVPQQ
ncbi:hypothetical protein ABZN20_04210 [Methylococcus sp. ANG]|uniref:InlB B-repeat-containing protein n=1 Tax=Methylococcus sp. ANG TaxID=3231903 RepID=UPI00345B2DD5